MPSYLQNHSAVTSADLTERELDVIRMITNVHSNEDIARDLYLGVNTIKTYVRTSYRKLGVTRRVQAVLWGAHHGLLEGYAVVPDHQDQQHSRAS